MTADGAKLDRSVYAAVIVAALGYFVDVYDLILFSVVRVASLRALGLSDEELLPTGVYLLNMQMAGMLVGGILWGVLGDKRGRLSVLFGSILLYSAANIANGLISSVGAYAVVRFVAGVGLAGELGAGITLVSEILPRHSRGYSTMIVATVGVMGGAAAAVVGDWFDWRTSYFIGGGLGLALLVLRISVRESGMFSAVRARHHVRRGDLRLLFASRERLVRYLYCILVGLPTWYVFGILITFAPEFGRAFRMDAAPSAGQAVKYAYFGLIAGDVASGVLSQLVRSRKKVLALFLALTAVMTGVYLVADRPSTTYFYGLCALLGAAVGYWAVYLTTAAEQFGTNLRATVTTTVPNFVRGAVVPITTAFSALQAPLGVIPSAAVVGAVCFAVSLAALAMLKETYARDLDFVEADTTADMM